MNMLKDEMKRKYEHQFDRKKNYQSIIHHREKKKSFGPQLIPVMACMIVVTALSMPMWNKKNDGPSAADSAVQEIAPDIILNINITEDMNLTPGLSADFILTDQDKKVQINLNKLDFLEECCPEGFELQGQGMICGMGTTSMKESSTCYRTCYVLNEKNICVVAREGYWPFGRYYVSEEHQPSSIDGVKMDVFKQEDHEVYYVLFEMNDMYFDVEAKGITESELVDFLLNFVMKAGDTK